MSRKKTKISDNDYEFKQTIWRENGIEQKTLDEMFLDGRITENEAPKDIRESEPLFQKFTPQVFSAHFRKTKSKLGNI